MSLLDNENHLSDAEQTALELSEKFLNNAMLIINDRNPNDAANCNEVLSALITSQSVLFVGQCYTNALIAELEAIKDKLSDIAESSDFIASESPNNVVFNRLTDKESKVIYEALKKSYLDSMNIEPSGQHHEIAMSRIEHIANGRCFNA